MQYKLQKQNHNQIYKGLIIESKIRDFFVGRIWIRTNTPFAQEKIETYIKYNYFRCIQGIATKQGLFKKHYTCNRCRNEKQSEFIHYECARCNKLCTYCRHCINMGRVTSCADLLIWNGPQPKLMNHHILDWDGTFTEAQAQASQQLTESIQQGRNHLIHAV